MCPGPPPPQNPRHRQPGEQVPVWTTRWERWPDPCQEGSKKGWDKSYKDAKLSYFISYLMPFYIFQITYRKWQMLLSQKQVWKSLSTAFHYLHELYVFLLMVTPVLLALYYAINRSQRRQPTEAAPLCRWHAKFGQCIYTAGCSSQKQGPWHERSWTLTFCPLTSANSKLIHREWLTSPKAAEQLFERRVHKEASSTCYSFLYHFTSIGSLSPKRRVKCKSGKPRSPSSCQLN